jgi:hemerythrin
MHSSCTPAASPELESLREELFVRAECFLEAVDARRLPELPELLRRLAAAARAQFTAEERLLEAARAPSLVRHAQEHAKFLSDLEVLAEHARRERMDGLDALRPAAWLTAWLAAHGGTDRELPTPAPIPSPRIRVVL